MSVVVVEVVNVSVICGFVTVVKNVVVFFTVLVDAGGVMVEVDVKVIFRVAWLVTVTE